MNPLYLVIFLFDQVTFLHSRQQLCILIESDGKLVSMHSPNQHIGMIQHFLGEFPFLIKGLLEMININFKKYVA
ncbi:hypothetical protein D3C78_1279960 [compost metagenome]